jgi:hypothetical protein
MLRFGPFELDDAHQATVAELLEQCASRHAASLRAFEDLNGGAVLT